MVVISPTWPPLSVPSATMASTPISSSLLASIGLATTGITNIPLAFQSLMYFLGIPAPVVTIFTSSSRTIAASSSIWGCISIRFTPNFSLVSSLHLLIFSRSISGFIPPEPISPSPPALDTAAANSPVATFAIPP